MAVETGNLAAWRREARITAVLELAAGVCRSVALAALPVVLPGLGSFDRSGPSNRPAVAGRPGWADRPSTFGAPLRPNRRAA